jgi:hypothetical protein
VLNRKGMRTLLQAARPSKVSIYTYASAVRDNEYQRAGRWNCGAEKASW